MDDSESIEVDTTATRALVTVTLQVEMCGAWRKDSIEKASKAALKEARHRVGLMCERDGSAKVVDVSLVQVVHDVKDPNR